MYKHKHLQWCLVFTCLVWSVVAAATKPPAAGIATAHPLATQAGHEILTAGGNAFDAAVAITAALAVVEPTGSGLGGGGFWLLHRASDGFEVMLDGRERAPLAAHRDMYLDDQGQVIPKLSINGPLSAGIPGIPAAIVHLAKHYGKLPLRISLAPAIRYAREGFAIDSRYQRLATFRHKVLLQYAEAAKIFLDDDEVPALGYLVKQIDLANTLELLAKKANKGFYQGRVAKQLVKGVRNASGIWSLEDLAAYRVIEREPIRGEYRGIKVTSAAPPSSGGIVLLTMLNILHNYELDKLNSIDQKHLIVEAMRRAYRDRAEYLGDPDFVDIPIERLIHPFYAQGLAASIRLDRATPSSRLPGMAAPETEGTTGGTNTTHFSVLDKQGNRVAATLTINYPFGSGFMPPGTGVLLNDEMDDFSAKPGTPNVYGLIGDEANAIAPGKRPLSSMTPTFLKNEHGIAILGTPGGSRIISMVLLATLDFADGHDAESWVQLKRYHHQYRPDVISYEPDALTEQEINGLQRLGHNTKGRNRPYGNMQAVLWDHDNNSVKAASDSRGSGSAVVR